MISIEELILIMCIISICFSIVLIGKMVIEDDGEGENNEAV